MDVRINELKIDGRACWIADPNAVCCDSAYSDADSSVSLVVIPGLHDAPETARHLLKLLEADGGVLPVLAGFAADYYRDLTPWPSAPLSSNAEPFTGGGGDTLAWMTDAFLPEIYRIIPISLEERFNHTAIMGYSLGGLFALWAFYQTRCFGGCASCSGSLWYDGWDAYMDEHAAPSGSRVYLSLGIAEEKARNPRMAVVGDATRRAHACIENDPGVIKTALDWHPGGHFRDVNQRLASALRFLSAACSM